MTLPVLLDQPLWAWIAVAALVVSLLTLGLELARQRSGRPEPIIATADDAWRAGFEARVSALEGRLPQSLQHVALVRFDAFPGAGGQFSFSAALLDAAKTGLVLTAIAGRDETRMYAKWVHAGRCAQALSPEEEEALAQAVRGAGQGGA
jgi:hypothetical protein